jgi:UDPglucose--hexose-1-phosphate uridylyltransferase
MPELRKDPVSGTWVLISPERTGRPTDFGKEVAAPSRSGDCPFCPGNEAMTPPEVLALPKTGNGWQVRVVPNKYPAVTSVGVVDRLGEGLFQGLDGIGIHEVVIESPDHGATLASLPESTIEVVLRAYQSRFHAIEKDGRFPYVLIFKNHGAEAGATLEHGHSQLVALPVVPPRARQELDGARANFSKRNRCVYCEIIDEEEGGPRFVSGDDDFIALTPFASRYAWEVWLLPRRHRALFGDATEAELSGLARALKRTVASLDRALGLPPPYNLIVQSAPFREDADKYYHWHIEVAPRLTRMAGFEWATGAYINPVPPEEAALKLREIKHLAPSERSKA